MNILGFLQTGKLYAGARTKVMAAISDPVNADLVEQLESYVERIYYKSEPEDSHTESETMEEYMENESTQKESNMDSVDDSESTEPSAPSALDPGEINDVEITSPFTDDGNFKHNEMPEDSDIPTSDEVVPTEADDSTDDNNANVTSSSRLIVSNCIMDTVYNMESRLTGIKNLLNSREDTNGVTHVLYRNGEVQIFYTDSVYLDDVMGPVINLLNAAGYTWLTFNRLYRAFSAIVFNCDISSWDDMKPINYYTNHEETTTSV